MADKLKNHRLIMCNSVMVNFLNTVPLLLDKIKLDNYSPITVNESIPCSHFNTLIH